MKHNEFDVIILKPTPSFLSFLTEQHPEIDLPVIRGVRTNHTAYTIGKCRNDEATLNEVEKHCSAMFRHEISRLLGENACHYFEGSFFDFLMCFKFEIHSQSVLMEPSIERAHQLLCIKPRSVLLRAFKTMPVEEPSQLFEVFERMDVSHITENATVLIKNFRDLSEIKPFIQQYYKPIFNAEMLRMCCDADQWPEIDSFQMFRRYFAVEIHTQLIHLNVVASPTLIGISDCRRYALDT